MRQEGFVNEEKDFERNRLWDRELDRFWRSGVMLSRGPGVLNVLKFV